MFGDLPKLLDREFLFGFFLPAVLFVAATIFLGAHFEIGWVEAALDFAITNSTLGGVIAVLAVWFVAGFLLALNSWIIRAKEGYGWRQVVFYPLTRLQRWLFKQISHALEDLDETAAQVREKAPARITKARILWATKLATSFPADESQILPFAFGNTVRAFEAYPLVMYDLDAIAGWNRLQMVMPEECRQLVNTAKSQVDFMLNLWAVWWALLGEYAVLAARAGDLPLWWFPVLAVAGIFLCSRLALVAALRWGDRVKSAFDVFLPALSRELGLPPAPTFDKEREGWDRLSQAFLYRDPQELRRARATTPAETGPRRLPLSGSADNCSRGEQSDRRIPI